MKATRQQIIDVLREAVELLETGEAGIGIDIILSDLERTGLAVLELRCEATSGTVELLVRP